MYRLPVGKSTSGVKVKDSELKRLRSQSDLEWGCNTTLESFTNEQPDSFEVRYYPNGKKYSEGYYKRGERVGLWTTWYENGVVQSKINYTAGLLDGNCEWWYTNSLPWQKGTYKQGKKHGVHFVFDSIAGKKCGEYHYKDDMLEGWYKEWFSNGKIKTSAKFKNGKADGNCQYWARNGGLILECYFVNGREQGMFTFYYDNGLKAIEGTMNKGRFDGVLKEWDKFGGLTRETMYKNGAQVSN